MPSSSFSVWVERRNPPIVSVDSVRRKDVPYRGASHRKERQARLDCFLFTIEPPGLDSMADQRLLTWGEFYLHTVSVESNDGRVRLRRIVATGDPHEGGRPTPSQDCRRARIPGYDLNRGSLIGRIITSMAQQERVERQARVERAIASVRLEGLEPTDEAKAVFDRYIAGDLTTEQMTPEIQALNAREFGPIHVYRD